MWKKLALDRYIILNFHDTVDELVTMARNVQKS